MWEAIRAFSILGQAPAALVGALALAAAGGGLLGADAAEEATLPEAEEAKPPGVARARPVAAERRLSAEEMQGIIPAEVAFSSVEEMEEHCRSMAFAMAPSGEERLEDFRQFVVDFYASGSPGLGWHPLFDFLWARRRDVAVRCPLATLQLLVLRIEMLLLEVYTHSAESRDRQLTSFHQATALHGEFSILDAWLSAHLGVLEAPRLGWPIERSWRRVQRYYQMLWGDVHNSEDAWAAMEQPGTISDGLYHAALADVARVFQDLGAEWWPCRGTLIALLRHGRRSGPLSRGLVDVVERDIDVMLGVRDEQAWVRTAEAIEKGLLAAGWDRCWSKTSADLGSQHRDALRRDLLYCLRTSPAYMLLDVTSYITGDPGPDVFVHRLCGGRAVDPSRLAAGGEPAPLASGGCEVPADVGPLKPAGGRLQKDAIHPLGRCRAAGLAVPCPRRPLDTIRAMVHSGLDAGCIALPTPTGRDPADFETRRLQEAGLSAEDVRILRERAARLEALGFQSMAPYFGECQGVALVEPPAPWTETLELEEG